MAEILDSIEWKDGNSVINENDRLSAIKVLVILEGKHSGPGDEDYHHGITDTISLLLSNEEYEQYQKLWEARYGN